MKLFPTIFCICFAIISFAQDNQIDSKKDKKKEDKRVNFVPVPYMSYDRTIGLSVGAVPLMMYNLSKKDTISPQSMTGGIGFYSTNKSWFAMVFNRLYLNEDRYRIKFGAGIGTFNYQFFLQEYNGFELNKFINYDTDLRFAFLQVERRVWRKLFAGVNSSFANFYNTFDVQGNPTTGENMANLGAAVYWDNRSNVFYPNQGFLANSRVFTFPTWLGNDTTTVKLELDYNHYFKVRKGKDVVALRAYGEFGLGDINFNQQVIVGQVDLRGYTQGEYRGKQMLDIQGEYRFNITKKLGIVGFGGIGTVLNSINASQSGELLPSLGGGFRYVAFEKNHMNVGLDAAVGKDDWGIYFRIGEAF